MNAIGIMQGRLSPPVDGKIQAFPEFCWEQEFFEAEKIGFDLIDWIIDGKTAYKNPLMALEGRKAIKRLADETAISVGAVCADYFIDSPLLRCTSSELEERLRILDLLINHLNELNIGYLEIPFVDNSAIRNRKEMEQIIDIITPRLENAYLHHLILSFESSLPPKLVCTLMSSLDHPAMGITYDMGNSASLGYNQKEELELYGDSVVTVHVKDRILHGDTISLGYGDTDFETCFSLLCEKEYNGPYILQVARDGNEIESAKKNISFVTKYLNPWKTI